MKIITLFALLLSSLTFANEKSTREIILTDDNLVTLRDSFNDSSVSEVIQRIKALDAKLSSGYPIYLFLDTPGGSIQKGLELMEFVKGLNRPVHTITLFAASMGFQTVQGLGERYVLYHSALMSHKARGSFSGEFGGGLSQLDARFAFWLKRIDQLDRQTVSRTKGKQTLESYRRSYDNELWLTGEEAVAAGYADEVVSVKCDSTVNGTEQSEIDLMFFSVTVTFSKCPVNTAPLAVSASIMTNKGKLTLEEFLAKGGVFGKKCAVAAPVEETSSYYYSSSSAEEEAKVKEKEVCAIDSTLTLDKIKEEMKKRSDYYKNNARNKVEYSY